MSVQDNHKTIENRNIIVTVMGHVDHGKTSFLDYIRGTKVVDKEAGGITQNTRAHEVKTKTGRKITFIDTPGHQAFSKMRERGSNITDFVLLIVAADDGVQPQTIESINFAKRDNVPIIVGLNKVDLLGIHRDKIKAELSSYGVNLEEYGGDVMLFEISAKTGHGIDDLLEGIELLSDIKEIKNYDLFPNSVAQAYILEATNDRKIGNVALCILKSGNLKGREYGSTKEGVFRVRSFLNDSQKVVDSVHAGQPFWVTGLRSVVTAGEIITFFDEEKEAKNYFEDISKGNINFVGEIDNEEEDIETLFAEMLEKNMKKSTNGQISDELNIVLKTSTVGTLEAVKNELEKLSDEEVKINVFISGVGDVTEDEIERAKLAKAIIVTFQVPPSNHILNFARREKVLLRNYEVIYEMLDEVQEVIDSLGTPIEEEIEVARAKVKQVFTLSNGDVVIGCEVTKGNLLKGYRIKVVRKEIEICKSKIQQLKIHKNEVKEVKKGQECGVLLSENYTDIQTDDDLIAYRIERLN